MQPVASEQVPQFFGPYRVIGELGRGGNGIVYRAADEAGRDVAVKTVIGATDLERAYLRSEIHALRRIDHPGVVRIFDDGIQDGRPWFAMERLQGETLFEFIEREGVRREPRAWTFDTLRPMLKLVERICEPLGVMHASGIVHRDLKPENIILRGGSDPVIV
ncbi:MAG TPA: protein kinase, partial [Polyangiaceae bacterium]|nr:protein kinase [Polyangiaceae bacterium]